MTSFEYIEEDIKFYQKELIYLKRRFEEAKSPSLQREIARISKITQEKLQLLQQMKDDLYKLEELKKENSNLFGKNQELKQAVKILKDTLVLSVETETATAISIDGNEISIEGYWLVQGDIQKRYLIYPQDYEILCIGGLNGKEV